MKPDIYIRIQFKTTTDGGRKTPVVGDFYACPLILDREAYDCRLVIEGKTLELGYPYEVPVKFLNWERIKPHLVVGANIVLWEGKDVAHGWVTKIC